MADLVRRPRYQLYNGILFSARFPTKCLKEVFEYKAQPDDNFIITYPKSGTTWMQNIVISIFRKGAPLDDYAEFNSLSPFIDGMGLEGVQRMPRPGAIKSHLPYNHMPYSPDAKYIFVARNPRDVCVSLYYHTKNYPWAEYQDATFDEFFEVFVAGQVEYNGYFDHLLSWYPHRYDRNIWYTTYEQMKADPQRVVYEVAKFLGKEYAAALEKDNAMMNILHQTSFEYMKKNLDSQYMPFHRKPLEDSAHVDKGTEDSKRRKPKNKRIRKGIVGDWKSHFSQEQILRLDAKCAEKFQGTKLNNWWSY